MQTLQTLQSLHANVTAVGGTDTIDGIPKTAQGLSLITPNTFHSTRNLPKLQHDLTEIIFVTTVLNRCRGDRPFSGVALGRATAQSGVGTQRSTPVQLLCNGRSRGKSVHDAISVGSRTRLDTFGRREKILRESR